jgi:hypothetical protein
MSSGGGKIKSERLAKPVEEESFDKERPEDVRVPRVICQVSGQIAFHGVTAEQKECLYFHPSLCMYILKRGERGRAVGSWHMAPHDPNTRLQFESVSSVLWTSPYPDPSYLSEPLKNVKDALYEEQPFRRLLSGGALFFNARTLKWDHFTSDGTYKESLMGLEDVE